MTTLFRPCTRSIFLALLSLISSAIFQPAVCQARGGDDWVLVDRYNAQQKLANAGDPQAMYEVARMYELGRGTELDMQKAVQWYERALAKGQNDARAHLGVMYFEGSGVKRDLKRAVSLIQPAAENGNPTAQYYMGHMYEQGEGLRRDLNQAMFWYKKASVSGHYLAVARLKALENTGPSNLSPLREEPVQTATRANPPPHPVQKRAQPDSPAKVLLQTVLDTKWERNGRPASYLPSTNSTCTAQAGKLISCQSGEERRKTFDAAITYVTEATLAGFNNSDQFTVNYNNNIHKIEPIARPSLDGDTPVAKAAPANLKLGKQTVVHKLRCELQSVDKLFCVQDNNVSLTFTRVK